MLAYYKVPIFIVLIVMILSEVMVNAGSSDKPIQSFKAGSGGKIAFYTAKSSNHDIYIMDPDGSNITRLTDDPAKDNCPAWSPDGTKIVFVSIRDGNWEIYVMDADGGNQKRLTYDSAEEYHPDWSPDGKKIAFMSDRDGNKEIYVMDADGGNLSRLTNNPAIDARPDWFVDGRRILFNSDRDGNREIYVMDADGSNQHALIVEPSGDEIFPALSPDNTKIAYFTYPSKDVYVINVDGSGKKQLTSNPAVDEDPAWSRDGKQIVFQSNRDGNYEIYVMNADGSNQQRLTNQGWGDYWPSWSWNWCNLSSDRKEISASTGGSIDFTLTAGSDYGGHEHILLGSTSGTGPGFLLPSGDILPLLWDDFTGVVVYMINSSYFSNFKGTLDASGNSFAQLNTMGPILPGCIGIIMHFAYVVNTYPWGIPSNPVAIEIVQ